MPNDNRLSRLLHLLIHLDRHEGAATSERLAAMLSTNPVVVRRMMAGLREMGLVTSEKGHGGGWALARPLSAITLLDVHRALGSPAAFAIGIARDDPVCLVEQAVNARLSGAMKEAESLLLSRFAAVTLADLADDFEARLQGQAADRHAGECG
jgi:DNA-binding IscR family transcriptional regulator